MLKWTILVSSEYRGLAGYAGLPCTFHVTLILHLRWSRLIPVHVLPLFIDDAESVIRTLPEEDRTNGFFVAVFIRSEGTDGNLPDPGTAGTALSGRASSKRKLEENAGKRKKTKRG